MNKKAKVYSVSQNTLKVLLVLPVILLVLLVISIVGGINLNQELSEATSNTEKAYHDGFNYAIEHICITDVLDSSIVITIDDMEYNYYYKPAEEPAEEPELVSLGSFELTAYCPCSKCCGIYANGYTSTGAKATAGRTIAVDPKVIPYGTTVIINGHEYVASDCGGAIKGNRIDVYFDTHQEALQFGRQKGVEVYVKN